jgi:hypothetical protein
MRRGSCRRGATAASAPFGASPPGSLRARAPSFRARALSDEAALAVDGAAAVKATRAALPAGPVDAVGPAMLRPDPRLPRKRTSPRRRRGRASVAPRSSSD